MTDLDNQTSLYRTHNISLVKMGELLPSHNYHHSVTFILPLSQNRHSTHHSVTFILPSCQNSHRTHIVMKEPSKIHPNVPHYDFISYAYYSMLWLSATSPSYFSISGPVWIFSRPLSNAISSRTHMACKGESPYSSWNSTLAVCFCSKISILDLASRPSSA